MIKSNCSVRSSGDDRDLQSVHRQHQGQDRQGSAILPSVGQREGSDETQRAAYLAQVGLRAGARSRQRYYPVHQEPSTRPEEDTRRCKKRKRQKQRVERPARHSNDSRTKVLLSPGGIRSEASNSNDLGSPRATDGDWGRRPVDDPGTVACTGDISRAIADTVRRSSGTTGVGYGFAPAPPPTRFSERAASPRAGSAGRGFRIR